MHTKRTIAAATAARSFRSRANRARQEPGAAQAARPMEGRQEERKPSQIAPDRPSVPKPF